DLGARRGPGNPGAPPPKSRPPPRSVPPRGPWRRTRASGPAVRALAPASSPLWPRGPPPGQPPAVAAGAARPAFLPSGTRSAPGTQDLAGLARAGARGASNMADAHKAAVGVFRDRAEASNAIEALKNAGFSVDDISILMPDAEHARAGEDTSNTDFGAAGPAVAGGV